MSVLGCGYARNELAIIAAISEKMTKGIKTILGAVGRFCYLVAERQLNTCTITSLTLRRSVSNYLGYQKRLF